MTLKEELRARAAALGFEKFGVAPVGEAERGAFFREWLRREFHGEMEYLARDPGRRIDPSALLPGATSVVCVAKNYFTDVPATDDPREGRISRYAWGDDYHDVLGAKLGELRDLLASRGARAKICVDTSAVLEKLWARRAGLGWQGKHTNLLSPDLSSWFFLGEILTDAKLEPDGPFEADHCGTCTRCIDLCPTGAIVAPYVLDSRRCISYLTIEHRGPIPRELRPLMGNLIFGCDICQDVCPWNKFAKVAPEAAFLPRAGNLTPALTGLLGMTRDEFRARFRGSPVRRAKYEGFLRNVCVALGNSGDAAAVPALLRALGHEHPLVRGHAAWALGRLGAREAARRRLEVETDPTVREEIERA
jgi:epoxyqueuosine reductase